MRSQQLWPYFPFTSFFTARDIESLSCYTYESPYFIHLFVSSNYEERERGRKVDTFHDEHELPPRLALKCKAVVRQGVCVSRGRRKTLINVRLKRKGPVVAESKPECFTDEFH